MKYNPHASVPLFGEERLSEFIKDDNGVTKKVDMSLGKFLTMVCVNAQLKDMDSKYKMFKIAQRIHDAERSNGEFELSPEDLVMLKRAIGEGAYTPVAAGGVVTMLEGLSA